jgi:hypothetical protein
MLAAANNHESVVATLLAIQEDANICLIAQ